MKWFEPLIAIGAILLVIIPIVSYFVKKKKGTLRCECGHLRSECVGNCKACDDAKDLVSKYHKSRTSFDQYVYVLRVDGMKCGMCESHINSCLRNNFSDIKVKSSYRKKETIITSKNILKLSDLSGVIESMGYKVKDAKLR